MKARCSTKRKAVAPFFLVLFFLLWLISFCFVEVAYGEDGGTVVRDVEQTIEFGSRDYLKVDGEKGIVVIAEDDDAQVLWQKKYKGKWRDIDEKDAKTGSNKYNFRYPYDTTSGKYRVALKSAEGEIVTVAEVSLKVKNPKVKATVSPANKKQYFKSTGNKWLYYPVKHTGKGWSHATTTKDLRKTGVFKGGKNYNVKWDKKHKTTTIKIKVNKKYKGQTITISDSCRHRTWDKSKKSKVITKTYSPSGKVLTLKFGRKVLEYENHVFTINTYVKSDKGKVKAGTLKFHVHVKDKGEQVVDTAVKYLGRVYYNGGRRNSVNRSAKSLAWLNKHKPKRCYADCSSFVSKIYRLHGLWAGSKRLSNFTWNMGQNTKHRPKGMKKKVKRAYKNMGCVWLVNDYESGHRWAHTALIVGNNYYINVTAHEGKGKQHNACFQKCTPGSRNYGVKEVYNYRSW